MQPASIQRIDDDRFAISGDLVFETVPQAERVAKGLLDAGSDAELDLQNIGQVNSAGIALLVDWYARYFKNRRQLHFRNIPSHLQRLIKVNELTAIFTA
ncbi:MAG: anti-anti-sigma factor [Gammaproteobacteria bacterium]|nr:MAG: anti-anti-sigma factor [Gammaproteobacteria bacterium]